MCNDYERYIEWEKYCAAMAAAELGMPAGENAGELTSAADVRVNDIAPIMRAAGNVVDLVLMKWGFPPARAGGAPVFNFRSDGRRFGNSNRCLIPASAFFEFTGAKSPKSKWRFTLRTTPVFAIAGLWREAAGEAAFTMLTVNPGPDIEPFHDRQVVALPPERWGDWLYLRGPEQDILQALPADSLAVELARQGCEPVGNELQRYVH
jgi:putative SOS response-associated peptidase YedK